MKAHALAKSGDKKSAAGILTELRRIPFQQCVPSNDIAAVYAALGEPQEATAWLHQACSERNMKIFTLTQDPRFDSLRSYREFQKIIDHLGLNYPLSDGKLSSRIASRC